jgi:hypothetical protein
MSSKFLFHPSDNRMSGLRLLSQESSLPMADLLRRMMDHCFQPQVLDALLPHLSGQVRVY